MSNENRHAGGPARSGQASVIDCRAKGRQVETETVSTLECHINGGIA